MSTSSDDPSRPEYYDEVYFETGTMHRKSLYSYYRWLPEQTFRMAMAVVEHAGLRRNERFLDFGCAKGFLVKAMRHLFRDAYGCDWSKYAVANAEPEIREYVRLSTPERPIPFEERFRLGFAKDVLEHMPYPALPSALRNLRESCQRFLAIVPLGENQRYVIEEYERDSSHFIREDIPWWTARMKDAGFEKITAEYHVPGIKDSWHAVNPKGNVVLLAE